MQELLVTSYHAFLRQFPGRSYIAALPREIIIQALAALFVLNLISAYLWAELSGFGGVAAMAVGFVVGWTIYMYLTRMMLNRYAAEPFSLQETFALSLVFGVFAAVLFAGIDILTYPFGEVGRAAGSIAVLGLSLYALWVFMLGLVELAGVTKNQALAIIIVPALVIIVAIFALGFFAAISGMSFGA